MATLTATHRAKLAAISAGDVAVCNGPCGRVLPVGEFAWRHTPTDRAAGRKPRPNSRCKDCMAEYGRERYRRLRESVIEMYGGQCVVCEDDRLMALDLDHVNDDGHIERLTMGQDHTWLKYLTEVPVRDDLQVLCGSCHAIKTRGGDPADRTKE